MQANLTIPGEFLGPKSPACLRLPTCLFETIMTLTKKKKKKGRKGK